MNPSFKFILPAIIAVLSINTVFAKIYSANEDLFTTYRKDLTTRTLNEDGYYSKRAKTAQEVDQENLAHISKFIAEDVDTMEDNAKMRAKFLNPDVGIEVITTLNGHPVVSMYQYAQYDPENRGIGFCFGRAMFVNVELAMKGFDRDSIKKAFVVGSMQTGDGNSWGWHVTTIAQSKNEKGEEVWLALDPITTRTGYVKRILTVTEWYKEMYNKFSTDKKLKIYIADAGKFGPSSGKYHEEHIKDAFYNDYFNDMMDWFGLENVKGSYEDKILEYDPTKKEEEAKEEEAKEEE
ncbi:MAG: hypothetical protein HOE90_04790 [Bacteriovoracaceae bacterium]|nr:hypothetical protein [Bacteriovoracaceae bacterium]